MAAGEDRATECRGGLVTLVIRLDRRHAGSAYPGLTGHWQRAAKYSLPGEELRDVGWISNREDNSAVAARYYGRALTEVMCGFAARD